MILKYIFIKKEYKKILSNRKNDGQVAVSQLMNPVQIMIRKLFNNIEDNTFGIEIDGEEFKFQYKCTKVIKGAYYIRLETTYTPAKSAKVLNKVHSVLTKGKHRKDFNIILSFDGASEYYCEKVFSKFNTFERKMRNLIFNILVQAFGIKWVENSISDEIKEQLLKKGVEKNKLSEDALHELTIYQLEKLLFEPFREVNLPKLIDEELSIDKISKMENVEIIELLSKGRSRSLWDRYFADSINIIDLQDKLSIIRKYRNSVAHHKYFSIDDFNKCKIILNGLLKDLDSAIEITENREFEKVDMANIITAYSNMLGAIQDISNSVGLAAKQMVEVFSKVQIPKIQLDTLNIYRNILTQSVQDYDENDDI